MPFALRPYHLLLFLVRTVSVLVLCFPTLVQAETKTIIAEAIYLMGDGETPSFAEAMVLQKAKQTALEQAGTYVESYTQVRNLDVAVDEIKTIAGGVLETDVIQKDRTILKEGGERFYIKIRARVTTDKIEDLARRIKGRNVVAVGIVIVLKGGPGRVDDEGGKTEKDQKRRNPPVIRARGLAEAAILPDHVWSCH